MSLCIGIDLGTTYSCVYAYDLIKNEIFCCKNKNNDNTTPSYVKVDDTNNIIIGKEAKEKATNTTYYIMKRFIGKNYNDCIADLKMCAFSYKNEDNELKIKYLNTFVNPEDISSVFLRELKKECESNLNYQIKNCVITVPAYFNNTQRELTKQAGINAGLNVLQIINEPCAAAFAYKLENKKSGRIMIFDFGGGTLDISILDITKEGMIVINTEGDNHLGGEDIDVILVKKCLSDFIKQENITNKDEIINICKNQLLIQKLRKECEKSKILLTKEYGFNIYIENFYNHKSLNVHFNYDVFCSLVNDIINRCFNLVHKAININNNIKNTLTDIILIGGSTKLELIKDTFTDWIKDTNITLHSEINPDESVAYGACLHCKNIMGKIDNILLDVTSHNLGIETLGGKFEVIIPKNTIKPCKFKKIFSTAYENQRSFVLNIYEGENEYASKNKLIKTIKYYNLPPKNPGEIKFEIEFKYDENGVFSETIKRLE